MILSLSEQRLHLALSLSNLVHLSAPKMVRIASFWMRSSFVILDGESSDKDRAEKSIMEWMA